MKKMLCNLAAVFAASRLLAQGTMLVDQQSFDLATAITDTSIAGIGQSFTPTLSLIDYVQFGVADISPGSMVFVNLRQNSMSGQILGTTDTQAVPLNDGHVPTTYLFPTTVTLNPGTTYFLEPVVVFNAFQITILTSNPLSPNPNPYPGGSALHGNIAGSYSLWFSEGIIVPEPSTWALLTLGGTMIIAVGARKRIACRAAIPRRACSPSTPTG